MKIIHDVQIIRICLIPSLIMEKIGYIKLIVCHVLLFILLFVTPFGREKCRRLCIDFILNSI